MYSRRLMYRFSTLTLLWAFIFAFSVSAQNTREWQDEVMTYNLGESLYQYDVYVPAEILMRDYALQGKQTLKKVDAELFAGLAAFKLERNGAQQRIEEFVRKNPKHPLADLAYYRLGETFFQNKDYKAAIAAFDKMDPSVCDAAIMDEAQFKKGYSLLLLKEFDAAEAVFDQIKTGNNKYTYAAAYYAGFIAFNKGTYDKAESDLKLSAQNEAYAKAVPVMLCNVYYKKKDFDQLFSYGNSVLESKAKPQDEARIRLLMADAYYQLGDFAKAAEHFEKAGNISERPLQLKFGLARYRIANMTGAIEVLKTVAGKGDSLSQYASYFLGLAYLGDANKPFAIGAFYEAAASDADPAVKANALFYHAKLSYDKRDFNKAIAGFKNYLQLTGASAEPEARDLLAQAYLENNDIEQALEYLESVQIKGEKLKNTYRKVTYFKGVQLFNKDKYAEANTYFEKTLTQAGTDEVTAKAWLMSGEALAASGEWEKAVTPYSNAVKFREYTDVVAQAHYGLGYCKYNNSVYPEALRHFTDFVAAADRVKFLSKIADALIRMGDCRFVAKEFEKAADEYNKALRENTSEKDYVYYRLGMVYEFWGKPERAGEYYYKVTNEFPRSPYAELSLFRGAQSDFEVGKSEEAAKGFEKYLTRYPAGTNAPWAMQRLAGAWYNLKMYEKSADMYRKLLNAYPKHETAPSALQGLQESLSLAGKGEEFTEVLEQYKEKNPEAGGLETVEFESAKTQYFNQNYEKASAALKSFTQKYPDSRVIDEAYYYLADAYYRAGKNKEALTYFKENLKYTASTFYNRSLLRAAEISQAEGAYRDAVGYNQTLFSVAVNKKEVLNAYTGLLSNYSSLDKHDSVIIYAKGILNLGSLAQSSENQANLFAGKAALALGDTAEATDYFLSAMNKGNDEYGAEATYQMGRLSYLTKNYKQSLEILFKLNEKYTPYKKWVGRSYLLIADNYIGLGEKFQARSTLESLTKFPDQEIVKSAEQKLSTLTAKPKEVPNEDNGAIDE